MTTQDSNQFSKEAWDANADTWDSRMGDKGNDFFNILCWPVIESFLDVQPDAHILDIACGNGLTSRAASPRWDAASPLSTSPPTSSKKPNKDQPITNH